MKRLLVLLLLALPCQAEIRAVAQAGSTSLSWDASPSAGVKYNVYRKDNLCSSATGTFLKLNAAPLTTLNFIDTTAPAGKVCYVVRAVDLDGVESVDSNRLSLPQPAPPANLRTP